MTETDSAPKFMLHGKLTATPGNGDQLASILSEQASAAPMPGCHLYLIARDPEAVDAVWVTEVWESPEAHKASLQLPEVRSRIERAMPLLNLEEASQQHLVAVAGVPRGN